jgi:hypothetical protein
MRFFLSVFIAIALFSCGRKDPGKQVTTDSLLEEMTDLRRLAKLSDDNYRSIQFSSYDRRSTKPADSCWFSNEDGFGNEPIPGFEKVLKQPGADGTGEYLICDVMHPGAIVRLWTAGLNGKIRLFLDDTKTPVYDGDAQDFFWKTTAVMAGKTAKPEYADMFRQFDATYFPIPFSKRCRIEWIGDISRIHFYHVGLRIYDNKAKVETFRISDFGSYAKKIDETNKILRNPDSADSLNVQRLQVPDTEIPDSADKEIFFTKGEKAIEYLSLRISATDIENALRKCLLTICFDDSSIPQTEVPVGDFFGSAPGLNPFSSLPFTMESDGTMICRFVMPFKRSVRIKIQNFSGETIKASGEVRIAENRWEEGKSMHFRARWRVDHGLTASGFESVSGVQDISYLMASGAGRIVGAGAYLYNPSSATTSWGNWWGEGDEKIFVDSDTFPSFFGTGTEDYFNYSWSSAKIFSFPYCGQPRNDGPGNRGYVSNYRWHISDDIPFNDKIAFFVELGHHGTVTDFSYGRIVYFYALPGTIDDYRKVSMPDIRTVPYLKWDPIAYLGSAGFRYIQAEKLIAESANTKLESGKLWADSSIMLWKPSKRGERITFNITSDTLFEKAVIGFTLSHNPAGGAISVAINGKAVKFGGKDTLSLFEPVQTILDNHLSEPFTLEKGANLVTLESADTGIGKKVGIDFVWLKGVK